MKKYDVTALGEVLIDFTDNGISSQGNTLFEANPGGAPGNVLAMLSRLGKKTAFIGKAGADMFGRRLVSVLLELGIDASNLILDPDTRTTLAFVQTLADGDRDFSFYRNPGADMLLEKAEINPELLKNSTIVHFGSLSMTQEPVRSATRYAVETARKAGALISFDPNLRVPLWGSLAEAKQQIAAGISSCDILKIADNELCWFTGETDLERGISKLRSQYRIPLILLSLGAAGSRAYWQELRVEAGPFLQAETVETTGAGDTFTGCCLNYILQYGLSQLNEERIREMLTFANAAASIITTKKGALRVMPKPEEIAALMAAGH